MASLDNFRLVVFRAVAEQRSFRKAAEELYLTQPAVSFQIKALEEDIGVQLFDRTGAQIALTEAGKVLLGYSRQANALFLQAEHEIAALSGDHAGILAIGASTTIAQYLLPRILGEFLRSHPRIHPTMISGNTEQIVEAVKNQKIALGLIEGPARSRDIKSEPFLEDELVLIVSAAHEWAELESIPCSEIAAAPLLMRERGSGSRQVVEMELKRQGIKMNSLRIVMELDSTEAIKSAVEAGLGVGFVSRWAIAKDLRLGAHFKIVEVAGLRIQRDFCVAYASGVEPQGVANEFRRFLFARAGSQRTLKMPVQSLHAVVKSSLQLLGMKPRTPQEYQAGLERCLDDCGRMEGIVAQMLTLARVEETGARSQSSAFRTKMDVCLQETARELETMAETCGVHIHISGDSSIEANVDPQQFNLLCTNLLMNSIQHSPVNSEIAVEISRQGTFSQVTIRDVGDGIAPQELSRIFERFSRSDSSRSRKTGGTGLGLAICKAIVDNFHGTIDIQSELNAGTTVTVQLPIADVIPTPE
jgi:DNA-binding transcriptional LysR family regulator/anti-sigma regulatory factor (Ser/Thr protein kinase)